MLNVCEQGQACQTPNLHCKLICSMQNLSTLIISLFTFIGGKLQAGQNVD